MLTILKFIFGLLFTLSAAGIFSLGLIALDDATTYVSRWLRVSAMLFYIVIGGTAIMATVHAVLLSL